MTRYYQYTPGETVYPEAVAKGVKYAKQVVVISLEDDEEAEGLLTALATSGAFTGMTKGAVGKLQAALREFANPTPPKPDEPTGLGAVVEDAKGDRWVRVEAATNPDHTYVWVCEADEEVSPHEWDSLNVVRKLSDGVQS